MTEEDVSVVLPTFGIQSLFRDRWLSVTECPNLPSLPVSASW